MNLLDTLQADLFLGHFYSVLELVRISTQTGAIGQDRGTALVRGVCERFLRASGNAEYALASMETVQKLAAAVSTGGQTMEEALKAALFGPHRRVTFEAAGRTFQADGRQRREKAFERVLDLQQITSLDALVRLIQAAGPLAEGKAPSRRQMEVLDSESGKLLATELPKDLKVTRAVRRNLKRAKGDRTEEILGRIAQKTAKKKINPKDLEQAYRDLITELSPQLRLALAGRIYAYYLMPEDVLVANDELLVRKHQFLEYASYPGKKRGFAPSTVALTTERGGTYFIGGFADFASAAGQAAAVVNQMADSGVTDFAAKEIAAIRSTPWWKYSDEEQQLLGLKLRIAREWCINAAMKPELLASLSEDMFGLVSLSRHREVVEAIPRRQWDTVWKNLTLTDLNSLADRYLERYEAPPWNSTVSVALAGNRHSSQNLEVLGQLHPSIYGCSDLHVLTLPPYEEYARKVATVPVAERTAEFKFYLASYLNDAGVAAAAAGEVAEAVARSLLRKARVSDAHDWRSVLATYERISDAAVEAALSDMR